MLGELAVGTIVVAVSFAFGSSSGNAVAGAAVIVSFGASIAFQEKKMIKSPSHEVYVFADVDQRNRD